MVDTPVLGYTNAFRFNLTNFASTTALIQKYEQQNWIIADGVFASIINGVPAVWMNSTAYALYTAVFDPTTGIRYTCIVPHTSPAGVTFAQARSLNPSYWIGFGPGSVGLGNVDNTSDVNKPVSTAQAAAIAAITANSLGLGNVNNTSDLNKPLSTASTTALALKAPIASPTLTGIPTAPEPSVTDISLQIATTQHVKNIRNPLYYYGYVGDGTSHPLSSVTSFGGLNTTGWTLATWQAVVSQVVALTDEIDGVAIQQLMNLGSVASNLVCTIELPYNSQARLSRTLSSRSTIYLNGNGSTITAVGSAFVMWQHGNATTPVNGEQHLKQLTFVTNGNYAIDAYYMPSVGAGAGKTFYGDDCSFTNCSSGVVRLTNAPRTIDIRGFTAWVSSNYVAAPAFQFVATNYTAASTGNVSGSSFSFTIDDCQTNGFQYGYAWDIQSTVQTYNGLGGYLEGVVVRSCRAYNGQSFARVTNGRNALTTTPSYASPLWCFRDCDYQGFGNFLELSGISEGLVEGCWIAPGQAPLSSGETAPTELDIIKITSSDNIIIRNNHFNITGSVTVSTTIRCIDTDKYTGFVVAEGNSLYLSAAIDAFMHCASVLTGSYPHTNVERGTRLIANIPGTAFLYMRDDGNNQISEGRIKLLGTGSFTRATLNSDGTTRYTGYAGTTTNSTGVATVAIPAGLFQSTPIVTSILSGDYAAASFPIAGLRVDLTTTTTLAVQFTGTSSGSNVRINFILEGY